MTLSAPPPKRLLPYLLLIVLCTWIAPPHTSLAQDQTIPSFDQFIAQFPTEQQTQARSIWNETDTTAPPTADTTSPEITDNQLFDELDHANKNKDQLLDQLIPLRRQLTELTNTKNELLQLHNRWERFAARTADLPDLGPVYLKSLEIKNQYETQLKSTEKQIAQLQNQIKSLRVNASLTEISLNFTKNDWIVIVAYLIFTTILGGLLTGKQASMKDFFLGGRKLPWPAVCGSIIATELSAATFLIAPAIVFSAGGDMTYIQLALGTILARFIIGYFFIPVYYQREIYSPYDYMGHQLGPRVKNITTLLFMLGGILAQGARVYIAAKALQVVTGADIATSIVIIGAVSVAWTVMGGITTVIWTDAIQFLLFTFGALAALYFAATHVPGGALTILAEAAAAEKFNVVNLNFNLKEAYTLWCALFGFSVLTLASHGTDQLMAQRVFTCKNQSGARQAILWSSLSQALTYLLLLVGAAIFIYYKYTPLTAPEQVVVHDDNMKIFAIYIVNVMPPLLSGLLMAAIFATAISTLDSLLAALSQSTISILYRPFIKPQASDKHYVRASRIIVFIWGILLTAFAIYCDTLARSYADLIQFALAMAAYTYGALLGAFLLAFLPTRRDDLGLLWAVPLSMLIVFALNFHQTLPQIIVLAASLILIIQAFRRLRHQPQKVLYIGLATSLVLLISMATLGANPDGSPIHFTLAWPWHFPIGTAMTFVIAYLVGNQKP